MHRFYQKLLNSTNLYFDKEEIELDFKMLKSQHDVRLSNLKGLEK